MGIIELTKPIGKIGNKVYYEVNGKYVERPYYIPNQPGTPAQVTRWNLFKAGVQGWQALTPAQKTTYNDRAVRFQFSGFNLYMREYLN